MTAEVLGLTLVPMLIGVLASVACAIPGNFLILRRQALIGDAISHVALPGIVGAFLLTGTVSTGPMMAGAIAAAVLAVLLIELVRRVGRVDAGAATGVVFTTLFAAGVVLLETSNARSVHLDVEHALYGNLESLVWLDAESWASLVDPKALAGLPPALGRLAGVLALVALAHVLFWRALVVATFDEGFARTVGVPVQTIAYGLVVLVAVAAVAAFEAVGAIIVIAMLICPPAAARLMTNHLPTQVGWSIGFAAVSAILGFLGASEVPRWFGSDAAVSAAGSIATASGLILLGTLLAGPKRRRYGAPMGAA
jgi:manganese/zinc/iron transport system permease protein